MPNSLPPTNYHFPRKDSFIFQERSRKISNEKRNKNSIYHPTPIVTNNFHGKISWRTYCTLGPNPKPLTGG
jgi:hypothetical protein